MPRRVTHLIIEHAMHRERQDEDDFITKHEANGWELVAVVILASDDERGHWTRYYFSKPISWA